MAKITSIDDLSDAYEKLFDQMEEGAVTTAAARVQMKMLDGILKTVQSRIEFARDTRRTRRGATYVPSFEWGRKRPPRGK